MTKITVFYPKESIRNRVFSFYFFLYNETEDICMKYFGTAFAIALGWYCGKGLSDIVVKRFTERIENR